MNVYKTLRGEAAVQQTSWDTGNNKMASSKKNMDEEKYLKSLREMASLTHNRQCFDCGQRGPTYINMTIGSFVCMTCGGLLRGLNPPHRVKSISMASFTAEEMDFIRSRGNDFCRQVWLGVQNPEPHAQFDSKDEFRIRDAMSDKYEKKRWYKAPQEAMFEEAKKQNTTSDVKQTSQLSSMIGNSPPILSTPNGQGSRPSLVHHSSSIQRPTGVGSAHLASGAQLTSSLASPRSPSAKSPSDQSVKPPSIDLLADFGGDPFASTSPSQSGNFPAFAAFNSAQQLSSVTNSSPLQPASQHLMVSTAATASIPPPPSAADKYSALAELDGVFSSAASATKVNWDSSPTGSKSSTSWVSSPSSAGLPSGSPFALSSSGITGANPFVMSPQSPMYNPYPGNMFLGAGYGQPIGNGYGQFGAQPTGFGLGYGQFCAMPVAAAGLQYGYPNGMGLTGNTWGGKVSMPAGGMVQPGNSWSQTSTGVNPFMNTSMNNSSTLNPFM